MRSTLKPDHPSNSALVSLLLEVPEGKRKPLYERHRVPVSDRLISLINKICRDGASDIATAWRRGVGVPYAEIVTDVAKRMKVRYPKEFTTEQIEVRVLEKVIVTYLAKATPEERERIQEILSKAGADALTRDLKEQIIKGAMKAGFLALLIKKGGAKIVAEAMRKVLIGIAAKLALKQLGKKAAKEWAKKMVGVGIPGLNILMAIDTVVDIAGPAFRKTVPTVIEIALLRLEYGKPSGG